MTDGLAYRFPEGFLWGTATAAHQVEGRIDNDWSRWAAEDPSRIADRSTQCRVREHAGAGESARGIAIDEARQRACGQHRELRRALRERGGGVALEQALSFSHVWFTGAVAIWASSFLAALLRGGGDATTPSLYGFVASLTYVPLAGVLIGPSTFANPYLGGTFGTYGFIAMMIGGGTEKPTAAMFGGLLLGVLAEGANATINSQASDWFPFLVLVVILVVSPHGLFSSGSALLRLRLRPALPRG